MTALEIIEAKRESLNDVLRSSNPINEDMLDGHIRKQANADKYLKELELLDGYIDGGYQLRAVKRKTQFENEVSKCYFGGTEHESIFLSIAVLDDDEVIFYLAPNSVL